MPLDILAEVRLTRDLFEQYRTVYGEVLACLGSRYGVPEDAQQLESRLRLELMEHVGLILPVLQGVPGLPLMRENAEGSQKCVLVDSLVAEPYDAHKKDCIDHTIHALTQAMGTLSGYDADRLRALGAGAPPLSEGITDGLSRLREDMQRIQQDHRTERAIVSWLGVVLVWVLIALPYAAYGVNTWTSTQKALYVFVATIGCAAATALGIGIVRALRQVVPLATLIGFLLSCLQYFAK